MAIEMSQFYQVFFEEAAEHLAAMESLLLSMDIDNPDEEELNAVFRAAHSIKGSSGTFGFTDMAEVTHVMETLLDMVRKGEARPSSDMVDACLVAGDVLRNLLGAHRGENEADREAALAICGRLEQLCRALSQDAAEGSLGSVGEGPVAGGNDFELNFVPDEAIRTNPALAENLLAELGGLGTVVSSDTGEERAHWRVRIQTDESADSLRGVIEFVAAPGSVMILPANVGILSSDEDGAYGFFEPVQADDADEAYGFFTELPPLPGGADDSAGETAYGLFEPAPAKPSTPPVAEEADDGSFGLFAPLEASTPVAKPEVVTGTAIEALPAPAVAAPTPSKMAKPTGDSGSIRVGVEKVDQMINLVGELVITQAMLTQAASRVDPVLHERLVNGLAQLERNTRDLQESVMSIRMMPISVVFSRFPRVVRDISQKLGKQVELKMSGESTELDKGLVERITDPLTHLVRNSLDHGVESPERRIEAGKRPSGTITLRAYHQSGNIVIEVGDDGAGLNRAKILSKARERGLPAHDGMSDAEVWQLIFEPGFSTADQVTEVSGRGVGMDVVKRNIASLGGRIEIESMGGVGTRMTVRLPLTLAILDGMSVGVGAETYIVPLGYVIESLQPTPAMMCSISGADRLVQVRGDYLPVISLREIFNVAGAQQDRTKGIMVILEADGARAALFVDALIGQHQVVIKSLEANYRRVPGISGATIMGDGHVALILDAAALVSMARRALPAAA
ncbi:chemotaxis protein CheW [Cognatazoarcus halotolerans]|uniref:chemotaxis protein CheW n=1 Tax=Cognatazoarcus halotolerans TaxID=2686016 RepID=UPI00135853C7|nr:chemotaxis protein CheW [Cognatazoarcus halotolerans]MCB1900143.1 chemotaxis protein CheW [Rhodocyclaceae bacterium]MCP5311326.1 chemotaxis protein CheW [Zoogloeaceae bacterium]